MILAQVSKWKETYLVVRKIPQIFKRHGHFGIVDAIF